MRSASFRFLIQHARSSEAPVTEQSFHCTHPTINWPRRFPTGSSCSFLNSETEAIWLMAVRSDFELSPVVRTSERGTSLSERTQKTVALGLFIINLVVDL